ncbi:MAG TPA: hypothetical protein VIK64_11670, partial [Anaerolineales bacterium]
DENHLRSQGADFPQEILGDIASVEQLRAHSALQSRDQPRAKAIVAAHLIADPHDQQPLALESAV